MTRFQTIQQLRDFLTLLLQCIELALQGDDGRGIRFCRINTELLADDTSRTRWPLTIALFDKSTHGIP